MPLSPAALAQRVVDWYAANGRALPWRQTREPYAIWLSEVVLQQTRVDQGLGYWQRLLARFPTLEALAAADEAEVLKVWEGLGYYSRARNLHRTALALMTEHGGQWPRTVEGLLALPGVGPYTARALASLAFGVQAAVVDGNVFRVLSRLYDDPTPIDRPAARTHYQRLADALVAEVPAAAFNQGIMDLGATVCTPRSPSCSHCPLSDACLALSRGTVAERPVKAKRAERPERLFEASLVFDAQGRVPVRQRTGPGVWRGLYELPTVEVDAFTRLKRGHRERVQLRHEFSHYRMLLRVVERPLADYTPDAADRWATRAELEQLAFPRAWRRAFEQLFDPNLFS